MINFNDICQGEIASLTIITLLTIIVMIFIHLTIRVYFDGLKSGCNLVLETAKKYMDEMQKITAFAEANHTGDTQSGNLEGYDDEGNEHSRRYKDEMRKIRAFIQANHTDDTHSANLDKEGCSDELDEIIDCWQKELSKLKVDLQEMMKDLLCSNRNKDILKKQLEVDDKDEEKP